MSKSEPMNPSSVTAARVYLRSLGSLVLFTIMLVNFKSLLQDYTGFSIANAMTHIDTEHILSTGLLIDLAYFFIVVVFIHLLWAYAITVSCLQTLIKLETPAKAELFWAVVIVLHLTFIIGVNSYYYPTSLTAYFRDSLLAKPTVLLLELALISLLFFSGMLQKFTIRTILVVATTGIMLTLYPLYRSSQKQTNIIEPNIFIIGIDGLRPDHLAYTGANTHLAPYINQLLDKATIYDNTYSPQSRTYVAWMSILTGQYPKNNGARFNLAPPELINKNIPLVENLRARNYQSTYAMDERRFNQIDKSYGFDKVVGPQIGAADALISNFADLPYINPTLKHPFSKYLFPYLYINRAYGKAYDPIQFNKDIIDSLSLEKPNFLAAHFCLLHWPYTSKNYLTINTHEWEGNYNHYMYQNMLKKVDEQLMDFFKQLKDKGLLENAVVYITSDHGEGFNLTQDRLKNSNQNAPSSSSWGHGTNVLDQKQNKVLLSKLRFHNGRAITEQAVIKGVFSLVDILPSLNNEVNIQMSEQHQIDGIRLPQENEKSLSNRMVFVESALAIESINASFIDKKQVFSETISDYEVREDGRVVMRPAEYVARLKSKQRSVYYGDYQLALVPNLKELVLVDLKDKSIELVSPQDNDVTVAKMLNSLCTFYQTDNGFDGHNICPNN